MGNTTATTVPTTTASGSLPSEALAAVSALAAVTVPERMTATGAPNSASDMASQKYDSGKANKGARKKEKMCCYRCGEPGHFAVTCMAELCDICLRRQHQTGECPLLSAPKPLLTIYGVADNMLMFFETPTTTAEAPRQESSRTGIVRVTGGSLTEEQIIQQLRRLVTANFQRSLVRLDEQVYKVEYPRKEDLVHLLGFGINRVPASSCFLEFEEWRNQEPVGIPLHRVWVRLQGVLRSPLTIF